MIVIDASAIDEPQNADEMLALHVMYAIDGERIDRHSRWCRTSLSASHECDCVPETLTIGAKA